MAEARLTLAGVDAAGVESQLLAGHLLRVDRPYLLAHPEAELPDLAGESLLQRREAQEPLAYILGYREFYGRRFTVRPGVLIPRHETETLVSSALEENRSGLSVLDLGTGSGCIGITLAKEREDWDVTASDVSSQALEIACENAESLHAKVRFVASDLFENLLGESFDLIVSNPPYIGIAEELSREVKEFEPEQALFAGEDGLVFYRRIAQSAAAYLNDGGKLMLEVGYRQAAAVSHVFRANGWNVCPPVLDLSGVERVIIAQHDWHCEGAS